MILYLIVDHCLNGGTKWSSSCQNGGTFVGQGASGTCTCMQGYSGPNCETPGKMTEACNRF